MNFLFVKEDLNVILVDWPAQGTGSLVSYPETAAASKQVGDDLATFIQTYHIDPSLVYCIGYSLGGTFKRSHINAV